MIQKRNVVIKISIYIEMDFLNIILIIIAIAMLYYAWVHTKYLSTNYLLLFYGSFGVMIIALLL